MVKIVHKINDCIGCAACAAVCPKYWEMKGDKAELIGHAKEGETEVLEIDDANLECNQEAADSCPVPCIFIEKE